MSFIYSHLCRFCTKTPQRYKKSRKLTHPTPLKYINNVDLPSYFR